MLGHALGRLDALCNKSPYGPSYSYALLVQRRTNNPGLQFSFFQSGGQELVSVVEAEFGLRGARNSNRSNCGLVSISSSVQFVSNGKSNNPIDYYDWYDDGHKQRDD